MLAREISGLSAQLAQLRSHAEASDKENAALATKVNQPTLLFLGANVEIVDPEKTILPYVYP